MREPFRRSGRTVGLVVVTGSIRFEFPEKSHRRKSQEGVRLRKGRGTSGRCLFRRTHDLSVPDSKNRVVCRPGPRGDGCRIYRSKYHARRENLFSYDRDSRDSFLFSVLTVEKETSKGRRRKGGVGDGSARPKGVEDDSKTNGGVPSRCGRGAHLRTGEATRTMWVVTGVSGTASR